MFDLSALLSLAVVVVLAIFGYMYFSKTNIIPVAVDDSTPWTGYAQLSTGDFRTFWIILSTRKSATKGFNSVYSTITLPALNPNSSWTNLVSAQFVYNNIRDGKPINDVVYTMKDLAYTPSTNPANVDLYNFLEA